MAPSAAPAEPVADSPPQVSATAPLEPPSTSSAPPRPFHSLILDTGPLIKGDPAISTLVAQAEKLYTIPAVLSEIRDEQTRTRINSTLLPFLKLRSPRPESIKFVTDFARRTGDLEVLSRPDIHLIALTYELEIERNGGDWRLRKEPNQKRVNGSAPKKGGSENATVENAPAESSTTGTEELSSSEPTQTTEEPASVESEAKTSSSVDIDMPTENAGEDISESATTEGQKLDISSETPDDNAASKPTSETHGQTPEDGEGSDDSDGEWITPSNIKKHQAKENGILAGPQPTQRILQACLLTSDYAMQNVAIRINLNVVSPALSRITHLKSWVLRCHGCFTVTRKMDKQFCPSCGQATLTRTSCSTDSSGNFKIHLKRNFQWNNRGNVFSIPKPVHGSASGKLASGSSGPQGGKNGWGRDLILAEDQKEYTAKVEADRRTRYRDLMDEDYLPGILSGDRTGGNGRIKVGAGRNVNGKKRR